MPFEDAWGQARSIDGWLTEQQARILFDAAKRVPKGQAIVEIGSHHGRSTVLLAAAKGPDVTVLAVDPYGDQRWGGGQDALAIFQTNLRSAGVQNDVTLARKCGADAGREWAGPSVGLLFVDGAHDYRTVVADLSAWKPHLAPAAAVLMHDAFSSHGVTGAAFSAMFADSEWCYCGSSGSLASFRWDPDQSVPSMLKSRVLMLGRLSWFARNIAIKFAMRRGWRRIPPLLGHSGSDHPY